MSTRHSIKHLLLTLQQGTSQNQATYGVYINEHGLRISRHQITKNLRVKRCAWIKVGAESKDFINWRKKHDWRILAVWRWCYTGRFLIQQRRKNLKPVQSCLFNNIALKIVPCNITLTLLKQAKYKLIMMKLYFSYNLLFLSWLPKVVLNRKLIQLQMMELQTFWL